MDSISELLASPMFKACKAWQGIKQTGLSETIVWQLQPLGEGRGDSKYVFLNIDIRQSSPTVYFSPIKPKVLEDMSKGRGSDRLFLGAFAVLLRRHAESAILHAIYRKKKSGDLWIPIFKSSKDVPDYYVVLYVKEKPPELHLVSQAKESIVRASSAGMFTKKKFFAEEFPGFDDRSDFEDILPQLWKDVNKEPSRGESSQDSHDAPLSAIERSLRQKLTRRIKTLKKSLAKAESDTPEKGTIEFLKKQTELFGVNIYLAKKGMSELILGGETLGESAPLTIALDSDLTPGQNLDQMFRTLKKVMRAFNLGFERVQKIKTEIDQMERDLDLLKTGASDEAILLTFKTRYRALLGRDMAVRNIAGHRRPVAKDCRVFRSAHDAMICVARTAEEGDQLCKKAKSNDYWFHVVQGTGSHVIVPHHSIHAIKAKREEGDRCPNEIAREAAMLAIHFSSQKNCRSGEVYSARRFGIRKKKGMPLGLWLVDKAETFFVTYTNEELQAILENENSV